ERFPNRRCPTEEIRRKRGGGWCENADRFRSHGSRHLNRRSGARLLQSRERSVDHLKRRELVRARSAPTSRVLRRWECARVSCLQTSDGASILSLHRLVPTETACWVWARNHSMMELSCRRDQNACRLRAF